MGRLLASAPGVCLLEGTTTELSNMSTTVAPKRRARKPQAITGASPAGSADAIRPDSLRLVGRLLYGDNFQVQLAADLGISLRALHYYVAGERPISEIARDRLRDLVAQRREALAEVARWLCRGENDMETQYIKLERSEARALYENYVGAL